MSAFIHWNADGSESDLPSLPDGWTWRYHGPRPWYEPFWDWFTSTLLGYSRAYGWWPDP